MGINDWGRGVPLAAFDEASRRMLAYLRQNSPAAELWCLTLPVGTCTRRPQFAFPAAIAGVTLRQYNEVIRAAAAEGGGRLIDPCHPDAPYDTIDGFHPNAAGMQTIADGVLACLRKT